MEQPNASLQLILPTDKRNPCFTLYLTEDGQFLHVYYGLERLEVVPADADHPAHRMLVARRIMMNQRIGAQTGASAQAPAVPEMEPAPPCAPQTDEIVEVEPPPIFRESPCVSPEGFGTDEPPQKEPEIPDSTDVSEPFENDNEALVPDWFESKFGPWPWRLQPGEATLCRPCRSHGFRRRAGQPARRG